MRKRRTAAKSSTEGVISDPRALWGVIKNDRSFRRDLSPPRLDHCGAKTNRLALTTATTAILALRQVISVRA
jgi:hypothetical protein